MVHSADLNIAYPPRIFKSTIFSRRPGLSGQNESPAGSSGSLLSLRSNTRSGSIIYNVSPAASQAQNGEKRLFSRFFSPSSPWPGRKIPAGGQCRRPVKQDVRFGSLALSGLTPQWRCEAGQTHRPSPHTSPLRWFRPPGSPGGRFPPQRTDRPDRSQSCSSADR